MRTKNSRLCMRTSAMIAILTLVLARAGHAAGLRTKFGEVLVKGLKIGQTYSLDKLLSLPYRVVNTGNKTVTLQVDVIAISSEAARKGYEPIPDLNWVKLDQHTFDVQPNHEAVTDIIISIPNDPKLLGRRFEADIWARTKSKVGAFAVGMESRLLIQVASTPPTEKELKEKFVNQKLANLDFTLFPTVGIATDVPMGVDFNLWKERKIGIKIVNPNDQALHFRIRSIPNFEALLNMPNGFEEPPTPNWVKPEEGVVVIPGNSIKETALIINIPDDPRYRGKSYLFPISTEILEQQIPARVFYQLLVTTQKKKK